MTDGVAIMASLRLAMIAIGVCAAAWRLAYRKLLPLLWGVAQAAEAIQTRKSFDWIASRPAGARNDGADGHFQKRSAEAIQRGIT
ncbi:MAG: hypothetical protein LBF83_07350 [Spirochaetaceae bacterium]|jgi:hypothetical protein|nr:hypothetical protein [Spirochaetaceae bacterium]